MVKEVVAFGFRWLAEKLDPEKVAPAAVIERPDYAGPVVTPEADALRAPRVPNFDVPSAPSAPLQGSLADREQRARRR